MLNSKSSKYTASWHKERCTNRQNRDAKELVGFSRALFLTLKTNFFSIQIMWYLVKMKAIIICLLFSSDIFNLKTESNVHLLENSARRIQRKMMTMTCSWCRHAQFYDSTLHEWNMNKQQVVNYSIEDDKKKNRNSIHISPSLV